MFYFFRCHIISEKYSIFLSLVYFTKQNNKSIYIIANGKISFFPMAKQLYIYGASLVAQLVKNLPAMWETWVPTLGWEDPLEKGKATHSSTLAWRIPWAV